MRTVLSVFIRVNPWLIFYATRNSAGGQQVVHQMPRDLRAWRASQSYTTLG